MSNYRVRQVLALGPMPDRQLRLLIALATWMNDESLHVRLGFDALLETSGSSRNTVRRARRELGEREFITWESKPGRGCLTLWTVQCLPPLGCPQAAGKGVNHADPVSRGGEKGSTTPGKGVNHDGEKGHLTRHLAGTSRQELKRVAKSSSFSLSRTLADMLTAAVPQASEREIEQALTSIETRHAFGEIRSVRAYLKAVIEDGGAAELVEAANRPGAGAPMRRLSIGDRAAEDAEALKAMLSGEAGRSAACRSDDHEFCPRPAACPCDCHPRRVVPGACIEDDAWKLAGTGAL